MSEPNPSPWVLANEPTSLGDPTNLVTLVDGQTFCLSGRSGDLGGNRAHGVFFADRRVLATQRLTVDGAPLEPLAVSLTGATQATFVGRSLPPAGAPSGRRLLVLRRRRLGTVLHEEIEVRNTSPEPATTHVTLAATVDFADVFAVKEGREVPEGEHAHEVRDGRVLHRWRLGDVERRVELVASGGTPQASGTGFAWELTIPAHGRACLTLDLHVALGDTWVGPAAPHARAAGRDRARAWLAAAPALRTADRRLGTAYDRAVADVEALRLHDPTGRHRPVIAAGAPWFMTLFGRDALISAYMALPVDPDLALGVLEALADLQGTRVDPVSEEEPGRIMHETRYGGVAAPTLMGGSTYYGSADATPLFVVLLGELSRWGLPEADLRRLLPAADRALAWLDDHGDRDGDGWVEYRRTTPSGLANQGWKDSWDGIRYRDGRVAEAPIALCEVQAYAYAAHRARAAVARRLGDVATAMRHDDRATDMAERFDRQFWLPEAGWYAVGLDADKRPIDSLTSNIGHCLWAGIVRPDRAAAVAHRLVSPDLWSGWGIRTLSASDGGYDPMSYHCGTVWPHDSALGVAGLRRYGFVDAACRVAEGLLDAAQAWGGRLPELFCGLDRDEVETPVPFPTSCSPQAWAAATPFLLLRTLLGLEPDGAGGLRVDPVGPAARDDLSLTGVPAFGTRFDVRIDDGRARVTRSATVSPG